MTDVLGTPPVAGSGGATRDSHPLVAPGARLVDAAAGRTLAGTELSAAIEAAASGYHEMPGGVIFARVGITVPSALRYLGAWSAGRPVALLDPALQPATLADLVERYEPAAVVGLDEGGAGADPGELPKGYRRVEHATLGPAWVTEATPAHTPHPDLGILLATSGSTGSPKLVRLSRAAVLDNARAITGALRLSGTEVAPTSLPLFYSYGMSVLNSHLSAGATVVVVDGGVLAREFWQAFDAYGATSLAGVPYSYEMLARIRWKPAKHPTLRTLTQAGGRLRPELISAFHEQITAEGGRFYVMWGTTEAAPRMTTLPAERLPEKLGSVGPALDGGTLSIRTADGTETTEPGVTGEIIYRGRNVMMGYAQTAADLARGDETGGVLPTGDLGHLDEDGFAWITGRIKRIGKVFGIRVNLDDIEQIARATGLVSGPLVAVAAGERVVLWCEGAVPAELGPAVAGQLKVHKSAVDVRAVDALPLLPNGKIDYRSLEAGAAI